MEITPDEMSLREELGKVCHKYHQNTELSPKDISDILRRFTLSWDEKWEKNKGE